MITENQIIYTLLNTVRSGEFNLDEPISERLLRNYLKTHRASHLSIFTSKGHHIPNSCFQPIEPLRFEKQNTQFIAENLPKIISFDKHRGIRLFKDFYEIIVSPDNEWRMNQKSRFNKYHPSVKIQNNIAEIYFGQINDNNQLNDDFSNSPLNLTVKTLLQESSGEIVFLDGEAVLVDPDDSPGYDFTTSPYPFPNERIDMLINSVTARELNIFIRMKNDDIGNKFSNETDNPQTEEF